MQNNIEGRDELSEVLDSFEGEGEGACDRNTHSSDGGDLQQRGAGRRLFQSEEEESQNCSSSSCGSGTSSASRSRGVHNRLYAQSLAKQAEGREKREQIAISLAKPAPAPKKISPKEASSLFDRLYDDGVQKQISLGRKKNVTQEITPTCEKNACPIISTTKANVLYDRLYSEAKTKQIKELRPSEVDRPKVKVISPRQAHSLYERLYGETTLTLHRARFAGKG